MIFEAAGITDIGLLRKENQDNLLMLPKRGVFAVADGMGGHAGGKLASTIAIDVLKQWIEANEVLDQPLIEAAIREANKKILEKGQQEQKNGMGTTLTLTFFQEDVCRIVHIGDSRAYLISDEGTIALTHDHSLVGELLAQGSITRDEAQNHPHRNILTRALGSEAEALPEWNQVACQKIRYLLLCTDGLYNLVTEQEITDIVMTEGKTLEEKNQAFVDLAKSRGGFDNITAILIKQEG